MRIFTNGDLISQENFFSGSLTVVFLDILYFANEAETRVLIGQPSHVQHMGLHKWLSYVDYRFLILLHEWEGPLKTGICVKRVTLPIVN